MIDIRTAFKIYMFILKNGDNYLKVRDFLNTNNISYEKAYKIYDRYKEYIKSKILLKKKNTLENDYFWNLFNLDENKFLDINMILRKGIGNFNVNILKKQLVLIENLNLDQDLLML